MRKSILVIGIGNEYRGDDGAGLAVSRAIQAYHFREVETREEASDGLALMELWKGFDTVIVADAIYTDEKVRPGRIYRFKAHEQPIATKFFNCSTHAFGLAEAIELSRALGQLPKQFLVYGIEGTSFSEKKGLSVEVGRAVIEVEQKIIFDIQAVKGASDA